MDDAKDTAALASVLAQQGKFADAIRFYSIAIDKYSDKALLHEQLSQCLLETEQYDEAHAAALQAYSLEPAWPDAVLTLARCSLSCGFLAEAGLQFDQYLGMRPEDAAAAEELAEVKQLQHRHLAQRIGVPGLQIEEQHGAESGPGHVVWEAGIVLSQYLVKHAELVKGKRVVELGCGTGVVGITAACLGATVLLTDTVRVVPHAQHNADINAAVIEGQGGSAQGAAVDWEAQCDGSPLLGDWDVVIGADLIYAQKDISLLVNTLQTLRQRSRHVDIIIAHKERNVDITQSMLAELQSQDIVMQVIHKVGAIVVYAAFQAV